MFLRRQRYRKTGILCRGIELPCKRQAVFILQTAENPQRNVLFPECPHQRVRMLLQNRNPRALQDQHIAARRGEANGAQQHVAPGGKAAADHCFIALCLQRFQRACDRQERSHVIALAVRAAAVRLGALDGFQLPACAARQHRRPVFAREIGVLRSIGASRRDISRVFNAETLTIGFAAGAIGIGITLLLILPLNAIIHHLSGLSGVAALPAGAAVILVAISMLLTFLAGLIPSRIAAKKDPVIALRSE